MAYYDLRFMDNILQEYFATLATCVLTRCGVPRAWCWVDRLW